MCEFIFILSAPFSSVVCLDVTNAPPTEVSQQNKIYLYILMDPLPTFIAYMPCILWEKRTDENERSLPSEIYCIQDFGSICIHLWMHVRLLAQAHSLSTRNPCYLKSNESEDLEICPFNLGITYLIKVCLKVLETWLDLLQCFNHLLH